MGWPRRTGGRRLFLRQLVDRVDPVQEHAAETRRQEDRGVDVLRGADVAGGGPLTPGRDQRAHPGAEHLSAVRIEDGKSALDADRNVGAADLLAVVDPGAAGAGDLVLLFPPVVGHSRMLLSVIRGHGTPRPYPPPLTRGCRWISGLDHDMPWADTR